MENKTRTEIKTGIWIKVAKDPETGDPIIIQGPETKLADAIGLLRYALLTYETKYKLDLEYSNLDVVKRFLDDLSLNVGQMQQMVKVVESTMLRTTAMAQNLNMKEQKNG